MLVSGEPLLSPALLARVLAGRLRAVTSPGATGRLDTVLGGTPRLFAYGRQALAVGLSGLPPGDVLCPAYICDTAVDGIRAAGRRPRYYAVDRRLCPDWDSIPGSQGCAALLVVHYFGFRSDLEAAIRFCTDRGLILIEDCAHAFLSRIGGLDVGTRGALAIYSWRKFLPVARGGALVSRANNIGQDRSETRHWKAATGCAEALRQAGKWGLFTSGSQEALRGLGGVLSDERSPGRSASATWEPPDTFAASILAAEWPRMPMIATAHRENFGKLRQAISRTLAPGAPVRCLLGDAGDATAPWCLPLLLPDREDRDRLLERLLLLGIGAWTWPDLPPDVTPESWPSVVALAGRTLCLPVHRDVDDRNIDCIARAVTGEDRGPSAAS
jgi:dTDP-4-amino-4,6-dideoxygalactose transaminase